MQAKIQPFPAEAIAAAKAAQAKTGCLPSITLAQWALESGYGKYHMDTANNYFGIKWYVGCKYPFVLKQTNEEVNGKTITITAKFVSFPSLEAAVEYHDELLMNPTHVYRQAIPYMRLKDWKTALKIIAPHYATDSKYVAKITSIINQFKLYSYD